MRGPKPARNARRDTSTSTMARLLASVVSSNGPMRSVACIVDLLDQLAQRGYIGAVELAMAAEVRHQRRDPAVEQSLQQPLALVQQPGLATEHRRVEVAAAVP